MNQSSDEAIRAQPCDRDQGRRSIPEIPSTRREPSVAYTLHQLRRLSLISEGKP
jgi:hypothetical protein